MSPATQKMSLVGGIVVVLLGLYEVFTQGKWILIVLGLLILAFTVSSMVRSKSKED